MKIIGLQVKQVTIGRFFPQEGKLEFSILFNDGTDKEILKVFNTSDPEAAAEKLVADLKKMERNIHKDEEDESFIGERISVIIKGEDKALKSIAQFIERANSIVEKIRNKKNAEGYLDIVRKLKELKVNF